MKQEHVTIALFTSIVLLMAFASAGVVGEARAKANAEVAKEAIKAGLVQDSKGHWVKPEIRECLK